MRNTVLSGARILASLAFVPLGLAACSSNESIATSTADSGERDGIADASSFDVSSDLNVDDAAGRCGATRWNARYGGSAAADAQAREEGYAVATDRTGNVFVSGTYVGDADFGGGARHAAVTNPSMFLLKLDPAGAHVWSKGFGAPAPGLAYEPLVQGFAVAADANANVIVGGALAGIVDFGGGALRSTAALAADAGAVAPQEAGTGEGGLADCPPGVCSTDGFLAKYDASGAHLWSRTFGAEGSDATRAVAFDAQGNTYVAGSFEITMALGGPSLTSAGKSDGIVAKLDSQGHHLWSVRFGGPGDDAAISLAVDSTGNVIATGVISDTVMFGSNTLTSKGAFDGVVVKLDAADGHVLWAKSAGTSDKASLQTVAVDKQDAIAVVGIYMGSVDLGTGVINGAGGWDSLVAKFDSAGNTLWVKSFGSNGDDSLGPVAVGPNGRIVAVGQTRSTGGLDLGGGLIGGGADAQSILVELDPTSGYVCSRSFGGPSAAYGLAVDAAGNVIATGWFKGKIDLGLGPLASSGGEDIFVASFAP